MSALAEEYRASAALLRERAGRLSRNPAEDMEERVLLLRSEYRELLAVAKHLQHYCEVRQRRSL